jgi:hypothetical protein
VSRVGCLICLDRFRYILPVLVFRGISVMFRSTGLTCWDVLRPDVPCFVCILKLAESDLCQLSTCFDGHFDCFEGLLPVLGFFVFYS